LGTQQISELAPRTAFGNYRVATLEPDLTNSLESKKSPQRNLQDRLRRIHTEARKPILIHTETETLNETEPPSDQPQVQPSLSNTSIPRLDLQRRIVPGKRSDKRTATLISNDQINFTDYYEDGDNISPDTKNRLTRTSRVSPKPKNSPTSETDLPDISENND